MKLSEVGVASIEQLQSSFLLERLAHEQHGRYWFRERGLDAEPGSVVLFQCLGQVVGFAVLLRHKRFSRPDDGYNGWLQFDPKTIRAIGPFGPETIRDVWPNFKRFSHARLKLDGARFSSFAKKLIQRGPTRLAELVWRAAAAVAGPSGRGIFSREDVRVRAGIERDRWDASYSPTFQGMRVDQPGGAPLAPSEFKNVFRRVERGRYRLAPRGLTLFLKTRPADGPAARTVASVQKELDDEGYFSPSKLKDERTRAIREVVQRRGQPDFRRRLLQVYAGRCAVTRCNAAPALEAAHIVPYRGPQSDHVSNGLLLRSDIHALFDLNLLGINPDTLKLTLAPILHGTTYAKLIGRKIRRPKAPEKQPNQIALQDRWRRFQRTA